MSSNTLVFQKVISDDGREVDASFAVSIVGDSCDLYIAAGGGSSSVNAEYPEGLRILLGRLGRADATIRDLVLDSSRVKTTSIENRRLNLAGIKYPFRVPQNEDLDGLRARIGTAAQKAGRAPLSKGGGNSTKRLRFSIELPSGSPGLHEVLRATPPSSVPRQYLARLCWNSRGWTCPTGEASKSEQSDTYNASMGFGHEEWLFNKQWVLGGWKYGFLQPVNSSYAKVQGQTLDVRLYTISPDSRWFYVGEIQRCEVLTEGAADDARKEFKIRGWLDDMEQHVVRVGGDVEGLRQGRSTLLFNVRFRPGDLEQYDPMVVVGEQDAIRRLRRYTLVQLQGAGSEIERQWVTRVAATQLRPTGKRTRAALGPKEIDLVHNQLQNELFELLVRKHGREAVVLEDGFVDIKLRRGRSVKLIEVKSESLARAAIRHGLGQLLEYAFVCEQNGEHVDELIVAAPGELGSRDAEYIEHLRTRRGLPLRYVCIRRGLADVEID